MPSALSRLRPNHSSRRYQPGGRKLTWTFWVELSTPVSTLNPSTTGSRWMIRGRSADRCMPADTLPDWVALGLGPGCESVDLRSRFCSRYPPSACCRLKGRSSERPLLLMGPSVRTSVYVDGFNLYYGAVKDTPFKWLNLVDLARQLVPGGHVVGRLKYFTARVSGVSDHLTPSHRFTSCSDSSRGQLPAGQDRNAQTAQGRGPTSRCGHFRSPYDGREGLGRESRRTSPERCLERSFRCRGRRLERYRSGCADPHGHHRTRQAGNRGLSRSLVDGTETEERRKWRQAHPRVNAEGLTVSRPHTGHDHLEAKRLVGQIRVADSSTVSNCLPRPRGAR